jgi:hypothetical protein
LRRGALQVGRSWGLRGEAEATAFAQHRARRLGQVMSQFEF